MRIEEGRILINNDNLSNYTGYTLSIDCKSNISYTLFIDCKFNISSIPMDLPIFVNCAFERCQFNVTWLDFCRMGKQSYTEDCTFAEDQSNG